MHKEDIARLLRHVYERQTREGVENAFRFRIYEGKDKTDHVAQYPSPPRQNSVPATVSPNAARQTSLQNEAAATSHSQTAVASDLETEGTTSNRSAEDTAAVTANDVTGKSLKSRSGGKPGTSRVRPTTRSTGASKNAKMPSRGRSRKG
jgi:hypothetical protein